MAKTVDLTERKQFRVLLNPVRQEIVHLLRRVGRPMTVKRIAERMHLSPMATQGHLKKLEDMGIVIAQEHPTRSGGKVICYQMSDLEVRFCLGRKDAFQGEREALAASLVDGAFRGLLDSVHQCSEAELEDYRKLQFGALHLPPQERRELAALVEDYLSRHSTPGTEEDEHWEYVLLAYRSPEE
ncbi:ArsR/SmtB family transcription factor [Flavonifractor hominis]|uniref:ArsR family transcriptional regulator n=1 Tax=Flavonifractor hominis TaxID=3133178 RepID=A0ABV1ENY2_9FIRM